MVRFVILVLSGLVATGCASVRDRSDKYRGVLGKQFRTRSDQYLFRMGPHQYEFVPYTLQSASSKDIPGIRQRERFVPAGTLLTVTGAKVSFRGGDWDYLIAELSLPDIHEKIAFEDMLGFSSYDPKDIERFWEPVDGPLPYEARVYREPEGRFTIKFPDFLASADPKVTATEDRLGRSVTFTLPGGDIYWLNYWNLQTDPLNGWGSKTPTGSTEDRVLDQMLDFFATETPGLQNFTVATRRARATFHDPLSFAFTKIAVKSPELNGDFLRGFFVFQHGGIVYVLQHQPAWKIGKDSDAIMRKLSAFKGAFTFR